MNYRSNVIEGKIIDFQARVFNRDAPDNVLWSALNLLEAQLCKLDSFGNLQWHFQDNQLFANFPLPRTLSDLGNEIGINGLYEALLECPIINGQRRLNYEDIGFCFRHDVKTGLFAIQKISPKPKFALQNDLEAQALEKALLQDRITLFKQPIVCAKSHQPIHFECLARMINEDGSIALPYQFIPAAERSGLITALDVKAFELSLRELRSGFTHGLATNISFATISDEAARSEIFNLLKSHSIEKHAITIEITETIAIHDFDIAANFANKIRALGARLSLDDFGAGQTSFKSLHQLPFDEVKIDGQYVKDIHIREDAFAFVRALSNLALDLGLNCIAERVETIDEAKKLATLNLTGLQGYLFGKPQAQ